MRHWVSARRGRIEPAGGIDFTRLDPQGGSNPAVGPTPIVNILAHYVVVRPAANAPLGIGPERSHRTCRWDRLHQVGPPGGFEPGDGSNPNREHSRALRGSAARSKCATGYRPGEVASNLPVGSTSPGWTPRGVRTRRWVQPQS